MTSAAQGHAAHPRGIPQRSAGTSKRKDRTPHTHQGVKEKRAGQKEILHGGNEEQHGSFKKSVKTPRHGDIGEAKACSQHWGDEQVLCCYPWVCSCCRSSKISRNSPSDLGGEQQLISRSGILTVPFPQLWQGCSSRLNRRKAAAATRGHLPCRVRCTTCSSATALHSQLLKETAPDSASSYPAQG